jgi:mono/diheme cytochrome c family protein
MTRHLASTIACCLSLCIALPQLVYAQADITPEESAAADHMHEHLTQISTIKAFVIMGALDSTREPANWLATHDTMENLPTSYEPFVEFMRSSARQVENAANLQEAGAAVSLMAQNCGNCHVASNLNVEFGYDDLPAGWSDNETHMQRHQWAVDRMWEGLIGPSDAAWYRGTSMLAEEPLHAADVSDNITAEEAAALEKIAASVHELGERGADTEGLTNRSRIYGQILGLCADCHTRIGQGPGM